MEHPEAGEILADGWAFKFSKMEMKENLCDTALGGVRVLDFANPMGIYCTKLLADLGADVIKVEPIGGEPARNIGPFFNDEPHPEKSLHWFHFNTNKRSITLNVETPDGRDILKRLVKTAHILVETFPPGHLESLGLGYLALREMNPRLVLTSITGFGQTGPWRSYKNSDMVAQALGGLMFVCGWPDRPPSRMNSFISYYQVSIEAAVGTLIAYFNQIKTGRGQHVDVSLHQSMPICIQTRTLIYQKTGIIPGRLGNEHSEAACGIFPCKDGYVDFRLLIGKWDDFVRWLDSEGMSADLKEEKWRDLFYRIENEAMNYINEVFQAFTLKHTKKYIYEEGQKRGFVVGMVNTAAELMENKQLAARHFFVEVEHPELGRTIKYIGAPYLLAETPWRITRHAPLIGEHNSEIYGEEFGFSQEELINLHKAGVI